MAKDFCKLGRTPTPALPLSTGRGGKGHVPQLIMAAPVCKKGDVLDGYDATRCVHAAWMVEDSGSIGNMRRKAEFPKDSANEGVYRSGQTGQTVNLMADSTTDEIPNTSDASPISLSASLSLNPKNDPDLTAILDAWPTLCARRSEDDRGRGQGDVASRWTTEVELNHRGRGKVAVRHDRQAKCRQPGVLLQLRREDRQAGNGAYLE